MDFFRRLSNRGLAHRATAMVDKDGKTQAALPGQEWGQEWGRSNLMLVGESRSGKTALARLLASMPFEATPATVGIESFKLDVEEVAGAGSSWREHSPSRKYEALLAKFASRGLHEGEPKMNEKKAAP